MQDDLGGVWSGIGAFVVSTGKRDMEVLQYLKSVAFHNWLFGIEVTGAIWPVLTVANSMRVLMSW